MNFKLLAYNLFICYLSPSTSPHEAQPNVLVHQQVHHQQQATNVHQQQQHQQQHNQHQQFHQQQQQHAQHQPAPPPPANFGGENVRDQEHIKTHFDGQVNTNEKMSEEQMRYHYFKMHDHNNDNALDGLELIQAISHYHGDTQAPNAPPPPRFKDPELESIVDNILRDDDYNIDGYIDYAEFVRSQAARTSA